MESIEKIEAFKLRTKMLALRVIKLFQSLPKTDEARILGKQLLRSSTSVAANYRASCRSRSDAEFFSKISIVIEEADETLLWLEILYEAEIVSQERLQSLLNEYEEVVKIVNTVRHNRKKK
jgi:four helix bundle protein